MKQNCVISKRG